MRIYEYPLPAGAAEVTLMMPCPAVFLDVRTHSRTETIYVLARVQKERTGTDPRHLRIVPSGADFDDSMWLYIGSVEYGCDWVHVFEDVRVRASDR